MSAASAEAPPLLRVERLRRTFGERVAVDDLGLELRAGEVLGLLGPNGAGKSTTVGLILGQLRPDAGEVRLHPRMRGEEPASGRPEDSRIRRRIGVAPQELALYEELNGRENLRFFGRLYGLKGSALEDAVDQALDFVSLSDRARDRVKTYSGGMKRRLNLAAAVLHDPELILLDEPTVGVDPQSRHAIFTRILELRERGCGILYTTHYMEEAHRLCDRVAIMDAGRVLDCDTVPALLQRHGERAVLVTRIRGEEQRFETDDALGKLRELEKAGGLESFRHEESDLEAVFLKLTGKRLRDSA